MKTYFVSYLFTDKSGHGHGRTAVDCEKPIRSLEDIAAAESAIKKTSGFKQICILHWCPFEIETQFSNPS